jgi:hypothetical protein
LRPLRLLERLGPLAPLIGALFVGQFVLFGALLHGLPPSRALPGFACGAIGSAAFWGLVWGHRGRPILRVGGATLGGLLLALNLWVYRYYGTTLDRQVVSSALHSWTDIRPVVLRLLPPVALTAAGLCVLEWVALGSRTASERPAPRWRSRVLLVLLAGLSLLLAPRETAPPDLRLLSSFASLASVAASRETLAEAPTGVPILPSSRRELPNILLILTESVREKTYCSEPRSGCPFTPELDRVLPDRIPLRQMRSVASYTAVSVAALLTGRTQQSRRAELTASPTLFDFARSVRAGETRPTIAYWSAQSANVLERDLRGAVDSWVSVETLLGHEIGDEDDAVELGMDQKLKEYFVRELPRLKRPFVLLLHLLGTHAPYFVDEAEAPFQPFGHVAGWSALPELRNAYQDAVIAQDREVAACVEAFLVGQASAPWVILFTSDHGEAFGEHGAIHHGQNLYDEQIHVPAWIASGGGALDGEEQARLFSRRDTFLTHLDLLPTVLDLLGVWRGLALVTERSQMLGQSLLAPTWIERAVPMTNCTSLFPCPLSTWGVLAGDHAIVAQPWDSAWNCLDLKAGEEHRQGAACSDLRQVSRDYFATLPNGRANDADY